MEKEKLLCLLIASVFGLFSEGIYSLSPVAMPSNVTLEQKEQALQWVHELKENALQKAEPYFGVAKEMQEEAYLKREAFQFGCSTSQNHSSNEEEDIFNFLSPISLKKQPSTELYVFVSLSMPKPALLALNKEAVRVGAQIVLKGLKDNSYQKTASYLQEIIAKTGQGFLIHPELFKRYQIDQVPSFVLTTNPLGREPVFDVVSGHIPLKTALLKISQKGELMHEAKQWLQRNIHEN